MRLHKNAEGNENHAWERGPHITPQSHIQAHIGLYCHISSYRAHSSVFQFDSSPLSFVRAFCRRSCQDIFRVPKYVSIPCLLDEWSLLTTGLSWPVVLTQQFWRNQNCQSVGTLCGILCRYVYMSTRRGTTREASEKFKSHDNKAARTQIWSLLLKS